MKTEPLSDKIPDSTDANRTALVHDWLTGMRGGEKCLKVLCELLPQADLVGLRGLRPESSDPGQIQVVVCLAVILGVEQHRIPRLIA